MKGKHPIPRSARRLLAGTLLLIYLSSSANGSTQFTVERMSLDDGAPLHLVYAILQTRDGFMWFGTMYGLLRYDGYEFVHFRHDPADSLSLSNDDVVSLLEDRYGNLWVGTYGGGANRLNRSSGEFDRFFSDSTQEHPRPSIIWSIAEDLDGILWFGTNSEGLISLNQDIDRSRQYRADKDDQRSLGNDHISDITVGADNRIWIATDGGGLNELGPDRDFFVRRNLSRDDRISSVYESTPGILWVGTIGEGLIRLHTGSGTVDPPPGAADLPRIVNAVTGYPGGRIIVGTPRGVVFLNEEGVREETITHQPADPRSLYNNRIAAVAADESGLIWVSSYMAGLNKVSPKKDRFFHFLPSPADPPGNSANVVRSIVADGEDVLFGTGRGLFTGSITTGNVRRVGEEDAPLAAGVASLLRTRTGEILAGTNAGIFRVRGGSGTLLPFARGTMTAKQVNAMLEDRNGDIWVGTVAGLNRLSHQGEVLERFTADVKGSSSLRNEYVLSLYEDQSGKIWIGTYGGTAVYDPEEGKFRHYVQDGAVVSGISNNYALSFYQDTDGVLWIGTGGGLNRFDATSGTFTHYMEKDGLPSSVICGILPDGEGALWLSTQYGLSRFDPRGETFTNFDVRDGLQSNMFKPASVCRMPSGKLLFGGINGVTAFLPADTGPDRFNPQIAITEFRLFNQNRSTKRQVGSGENLELSHDQNYFSVKFTSLDYFRPGRNQYLYMLEGVDADWIGPQSDRTAVYTDLSPGTYRFRVKGTSGRGNWSLEEAGLTITISPPFWATWWFLSGSMGLLAAGVVIVHQRRLREKLRRLTEMEAARKEEAEKVRKKAVRDFHDELGHRLTKIGLAAELVKRRIGPSSLETSAQLDKIIESSQALSDDTRTFLWSLDPESDSLFDLVLYLNNFGEELFDRTEIHFETTGLSEAMKEIKLSMDFRRHLSLILKEAMNNSLRHSGCSRISLSVAAESGQLLLSLSDNGKGYEQSGRERGRGLRNMVSRARQINGDFAVESHPGEGTRVRFVAHAA